MRIRKASAPRKQRPSWRLWVVGIFFVLLHVAGVYDQVMLLSQNARYFQQQNFGDAQIAYFTDYPLFLAPFWIIAIWGGLVASILLLLRTRWAFSVALIAFAAQVILILITFGFLKGWQMFGPALSMFDMAIFLLVGGLVWYCRALSVRGVLW